MDYLHKTHHYFFINDFDIFPSRDLENWERKYLSRVFHRIFPTLKLLYLSASIDVYNFPPVLIIQMDFNFLGVDVICGLMPTLLATSYRTYYPFGIPARSKWRTLEILHFLVNVLQKRGKQLSYIIVDKGVYISSYT